MNRLLAVACALGGCAVSLFAASPFDPPQRSVSASRQFIIYCDDRAVRLAVSSFTEETKSELLRLIDEPDRWKNTIVITLRPPDVTQPEAAASTVRMLDVAGGTRIELNVTLVKDLHEARFPQQLVRAILLELEYRNKLRIAAGQAYIEPPSWLVEGLTTHIQGKGREMDVDVYKALFESNRLTPLKEFLNQNPSAMNAASLKIYQAYSVCLVQLLLDVSKGRGLLAAYIRDLPTGTDTATADLLRHFPALGSSEQSMEKWWDLSMARIAASDRYKGLSMEETEKRLASLLNIAVPREKQGEFENFALDDFRQFIKLPKARPVLAGTTSELMALSSQASPLFRPVVAEYQQIVVDLQKGKTRHTAERLKAAAKYRELILTRMDQIEDYLNWFEATQLVMSSNSFDDYMRTAEKISAGPPQRDDLISQYLDNIEAEMK